MDKKSPFRVSDQRSSSPPDVMDVAAQSSSIMYIVFADSISINKKRITSNYSAIHEAPLAVEIPLIAS